MKFRLIFAILGLVSHAAFRINHVALSIAIVAMVNQTATKNHSQPLPNQTDHGTEKFKPLTPLSEHEVLRKEDHVTNDKDALVCSSQGTEDISKEVVSGHFASKLNT